MDPKVNIQYVHDHFKGRFPNQVKTYIERDLKVLNDLEKKGEIEINCKFYKIGRIKQSEIFHHDCPHWEIEAFEKETQKKVWIHYALQEFTID